MPKERILVVDDEPDIRDVLRLTLEAEGYEVYEAFDGQDALEKIPGIRPDLIIVDYKMPRMEGPQLCQALKEESLLATLPIIMLTSRAEVSDKVTGINSGADDYLTKPFEPAELTARVKMILRRTVRALDANPLTKLPGNVPILEELQARLDSKKPMAICYADLDKFKAYNDHYGFERGDGVIRTTAQILLTAMKNLGNPTDFLGHIGGDDFVLFTTPKKADAICEQIVQQFGKQAPSFYDERERHLGFIEATDRDGKPRQFGFVSITVAVVTNEQRELTHPAEAAQLGAELKEWLKNQGGNRWGNDRRIE